MYAFHNHYCFWIDIFLVSMLSQMYRGQVTNWECLAPAAWNIPLCWKKELYLYNSIGPFYSKCGPWASCLIITEEPTRSAESWVPPWSLWTLQDLQLIHVLMGVWAAWWHLDTGNKANPTKELHRLLPVILGKFLNLFLSLDFLILKRPHRVGKNNCKVFSTPPTIRRILSKIGFFWEEKGGIICMAMAILFSLSWFIFQSKWRNTFSIEMGKKPTLMMNFTNSVAHIHTHQCFEI